VLKEAEAEAAPAAAWYDAEQSGLGDDFLDELAAGFSAIEASPGRFPEFAVGSSHQHRRVLLRRFPYHVIYQLFGEDIWILAVAHAHRRPNYWKDRTH
jgi:hypothetical protein